jgi:hypothetical protein
VSGSCAARLLTWLALILGLPALAAPIRTSSPADHRPYLLLIPIDSRPVTGQLPELLARVGGLRVREPPTAWLGRGSEPAQLPLLDRWLMAHRQPSALIIALDALAYGGLVQSRDSALTVHQVLARLQVLRRWKRLTGRPIDAFITIPRALAADPRRNLAVIREMLRWQAQGVFSRLYVTWDDALPGSPAPAEGRSLRVLARHLHLRTLIYPGADEVISDLLARSSGYPPLPVSIVYSSALRATAILPYDGIPLDRSAWWHAVAAGVYPVRPATRLALPGHPHFPSVTPAATLYVFDGGNPWRAAWQLAQLEAYGPVAVADVYLVNRGDPPFWQALHASGAVLHLLGLAAWGTPGNNLGTALAWAELGQGLRAPRRAAERYLLAYAYANDVVFGDQLRPRLQRRSAAFLASAAGNHLIAHLARQVDPQLLRWPAFTEWVVDAILPWGRAFEWGFALKRVEIPWSGLLWRRRPGP